MPAAESVRIAPAPPLPLLRLGPGAALAAGRAHEVCGPARRVFAAMAAGACGAGAVLWIRGPEAEGRLDPDGLSAFFDPGRLLLVAPGRTAEVAWCAEEALRSGAVALVVAELAAPLALTPVRRLHLAAAAGTEAAAARGAPPPLALLLTAAEGGCQGVETRWRLSPAPSDVAPDLGAGHPAAAGAAAAHVVESSLETSASRNALARHAASRRRTAEPGVAPSRPRPSATGAGMTADDLAAEDFPPPSSAAAEFRAACRAGGVESLPAGASSWRLDLLRARLTPPRSWRGTWRPGGTEGPLCLRPDPGG